MWRESCVLLMALSRFLWLTHPWRKLLSRRTTPWFPHGFWILFHLTSLQVWSTETLQWRFGIHSKTVFLKLMVHGFHSFKRWSQQLCKEMQPWLPTSLIFKHHGISYSISGLHHLVHVADAFVEWMIKSHSSIIKMHWCNSSMAWMKLSYKSKLRFWW